MRMFQTVYVYTTPLKKEAGRFKIGKADRNAKTKEAAALERIDEQITAGNRDDPAQLIHVFDVEGLGMRSIDLEGKLHKELKTYRVGKTEWFETGTPDPIFTAYNKITTGVAALNSYGMREEQSAAVKQAYEYFSSGKGNVFLFNAIMRYGKCFASYQLAKKLGAEKVLVLTYKPSVKDSWASDLDHVDFDGYKYFDAKNFSKNDPIAIPADKKGILFSSFQDIIGKNINGDVKDKWAEMIEARFDLVIIDEVHFGFSSQKAQELISKLNYAYRLDLSGTPINLLNSGFYDEDQVFNWTYIDEQKKKRKDPENPAYKWLPRLNMYTYKISDEVMRYADLFEENEHLTLNKFFGAIDENALKNDVAVEKFLDNLAVPEKRSMASPFNDENVAKHLKHMFWYVPSVNSAKALGKKLREHWFFGKYRIVVAAGNNDSERGDTLELVQGCIAKVDEQIADCKGKVGTITLSCGKLNTGVSVKKWHSVFFFNELESVQTYWQAAFRGKTPDEKNQKSDAYVFDFNPNRALSMAYSFAEETAKAGVSNITTIRELLETMNWMAYDGNSLVKADPEELLSQIVTEGTDTEKTVRKFSSDWLFGKTKDVDSRVPEILRSLNESKNSKAEDVVVTSGLLGKGKTSKSTKVGTPVDFDGMSDAEVKKEVNRLVNKARTVTNALPVFLFSSDAKEERVEDIYNTEVPEMFRDICGIEVESFEVLVETGFINKHKLNKAIESFNIMESTT
jgi:hypothetical protein